MATLADDEKGLNYGPIPLGTVHLCLDMQNLFYDGGPWATPWMKRVLPAIQELAGRHAAQTVFTRFMPPRRAEEAPGIWRRFYEHWREVTLEQIDPALLELVPELARLVPPATLLDKTRYSPFHGTGLAEWLRQRDIGTVILTGAETDVCVLGAALDAVDLGLRTIIVSDAICSSADDTHDALMKLYRHRFSHQIEITDVQTILRHWPHR